MFLLNSLPQTHVMEVLAAMIPCSRLYGYLGCTLAAATAHTGRHTYSDWLDTYSGADYLVRSNCRYEGILSNGLKNTHVAILLLRDLCSCRGLI